MRDYKTEPIIFDGLPDCDHEWQESIKISKSGGTNGGISLTQDESIHIHQESCFCSKCDAWRGQLGLEPTPELYLKHLLDFFDDVKMKLKDEGNCFVNLGDSYYGSPSNSKDSNLGNAVTLEQVGRVIRQKHKILQSKSLCMIPQRFAWGMIERGWILRNSIIWSKPNHMPESVTDRLTKAHEVVYHFVKQGKYYYDLDAIREPHKDSSMERYQRPLKMGGAKYARKKGFEIYSGNDWKPEGYAITQSSALNHPKGKNPGDVWTVPTTPYPESHFATFPIELIRRPILAGCPKRVKAWRCKCCGGDLEEIEIPGTVLDPFAGSGTVGEFCRHNDRNAILFELNPDYKKLIEDRAMLKVPELPEWCSRKGDA